MEKKYTEKPVEEICGLNPRKADDYEDSLSLYLGGIRIEKIDDFKWEMKIMTQHFPEEFGKDSMKCAGAILDSVNEETREKIDFSLRALGCTNLIKTKRLMDSWAANGIQSPAKDLRAIRSRGEIESQGR
jgi:hypothetical protein